MATNSKSGQRSPCVISNVLEIFGDRWTLLVIRDLLFFGKHEYKEFLTSPESIATNILADRLKRLACAGIIDEVSHPASRSRKLYYLTPQGKDLLPILIDMILWGKKHLPKVKMMEPIFKRVKSDPVLFKTQVLQSLDDWERANLQVSA